MRSDFQILSKTVQGINYWGPSWQSIILQCLDNAAPNRDLPSKQIKNRVSFKSWYKNNYKFQATNTFQLSLAAKCILALKLMTQYDTHYPDHLWNKFVNALVKYIYLIVVILIEGMKAWPRRQTGWQTDFPRVMPIVSGDLTREIKNITLAIKDSLLGTGKCFYLGLFGIFDWLTLQKKGLGKRSQPNIQSHILISCVGGPKLFEGYWW